jgi:hypothetical protein
MIQCGGRLVPPTRPWMIERGRALARGFFVWCPMFAQLTWEVREADSS